MYTSPMPQQREQDFVPMLFSLQQLDQTTPRAATPRMTAESSMSTQRRSVTPPGSIHTDATPPPPPPIARLSEDVVMEDPSSSSRGIASTPKMQSLTPVAGPSALQLYEQPQQYEDVWVTVYGFSQQDIPLILKEFHRCGDIINWGTFGQPQANYLHIQYQNKHGAQRALLRNGDLVLPQLIIGVKPLDARYRAAVENYTSGSESQLQVLRAKLMPDRPYRVEVAAGQQVPQQSRSVLNKVWEFVLGV